jgi:FtsH-binding integral membrane protein
MGSNDEDRMGFIRKVYIILSLQLTITAIAIGFTTSAAYKVCTYCNYEG